MTSKIGHFEKRRNRLGTEDWNFNITMGGHTEVVKEAGRLAELVVTPHPQRFHVPIPAEWLHITMLRVGLSTEYSEPEMRRTAKLLRDELAGFEMPGSRLDGWWSPDRDLPVLDVKPKEPWQKLFGIIMRAIEESVGADRIPQPEIVFDPHMAIAYEKTHLSAPETADAIKSVHAAPVSFAAKSLVLVRQQFNNLKKPEYYTWDVVEEIPIGL